jgi:hypothetical protein
MIVHHVKVDHIRASSDDIPNFLSQTGEVGRENTGSDAISSHIKISKKCTKWKF